MYISKLLYCLFSFALLMLRRGRDNNLKSRFKSKTTGFATMMMIMTQQGHVSHGYRAGMCHMVRHTITNPQNIPATKVLSSFCR